MDPKTSDPVFIMKSAEPVHSLLFLHDFLLAGNQDGSVSFWDMKTHRMDSTQSVFTGSSACVRMCYVDGHLITQDRMGLVKVWSQEESKWNINFEMQLTYCGLCRLDGICDYSGIMACPQKKSDIEIFHVNSGKKISTLTPVGMDPLGDVVICKFIEVCGSTYLLTVYEIGAAVLWDLKVNNLVTHYKFDGLPMTLDYDEVHCQGICGASSKKIQIFELDKSQNFHIIQKIKLHKSAVGCVRIKPDRSSVVIGGWDGKLRYFTWNSFQPLDVNAVHSKAIEDISFSEKGCVGLVPECVMAVGSLDCRISLWKS
ncbi:guanine nucleotide-binding protein subunit beta-like protein 1 [Anabrus simplex]|uniref:guanine nucleotide-binding protein subunit beta-like protein 1 n=1 Tax=Anabrus simplex TaxID=316456 RepID=UPI0035A2E33C